VKELRRLRDTKAAQLHALSGDNDNDHTRATRLLDANIGRLEQILGKYGKNAEEQIQSFDHYDQLIASLERSPMVLSCSTIMHRVKMPAIKALVF
jgi:hypothetical protein